MSAHLPLTKPHHEEKWRPPRRHCARLHPPICTLLRFGVSGVIVPHLRRGRRRDAASSASPAASSLSPWVQRLLGDAYKEFCLTDHLNDCAGHIGRRRRQGPLARATDGSGPHLFRLTHPAPRGNSRLVGHCLANVWGSTPVLSATSRPTSSPGRPYLDLISPPTGAGATADRPQQLNVSDPAPIHPGTSRPTTNAAALAPNSGTYAGQPMVDAAAAAAGEKTDPKPRPTGSLPEQPPPRPDPHGGAPATPRRGARRASRYDGPTSPAKSTRADSLQATTLQRDTSSKEATSSPPPHLPVPPSQRHHLPPEDPPRATCHVHPWSAPPTPS